MPRERVPLAEIVEVLDDHELRLQTSLDFYGARYPDRPLPPTDPRLREVRAMKIAADVMRIMASYENRSRDFVAQLLKDYAEGRWP